MLRFIVAFACVLTFLSTVFTLAYENIFVDPAYILAKKFNPSTYASQESIVHWADKLAADGPWSVMNKSIPSPSGNMHDYLSWSPYYWPDCTGVGNTTELKPEQVWTECPYYLRDGMFNPDHHLVNNSGDFSAMSNAVLYNALAWALTNSSNYSTNAAHFIDTWFINPETAMTPNLNYAQMQRGPNSRMGSSNGVIDLRSIVTLTSAILILRGGKSPEWTNELDIQMMNWTTRYVDWLTTSPIAYGEWTAKNNHGTLFYSQLAALQVLIGDTNAAINTTKSYFDKQFKYQIDSNGEQPLEATRTHSYHYRCFNLEAMITNAQLGQYLGLNLWDSITSNGGTIKVAADFIMQLHPDSSNGDGPIDDSAASIAAIASHYGDPDGKYTTFLASIDPWYPWRSFFLWNQPLSDSGLLESTEKHQDQQPQHESSNAMSRFDFSLRAGCLITLFCHSLLLYS